MSVRHRRPGCTLIPGVSRQQGHHVAPGVGWRSVLARRAPRERGRPQGTWKSLGGWRAETVVGERNPDVLHGVAPSADLTRSGAGEARVRLVTGQARRPPLRPSKCGLYAVQESTPSFHAQSRQRVEPP